MTDPHGLTSFIRTIPDYPKPGIQFRDITTLMGHGDAFAKTIGLLASHTEGLAVSHIAGIEARGFILGGALAHHLKVPFVPIRKQGKLPAEVIGEDYDLEYGTDRLEVHTDAVGEGGRVFVLDDLIATGGTALAAISLIERLGASIAACGFIVDLPDLGGRAKLEETGKAVFTLCAFSGH
ncbi:MAG: adenine phosphoribosyltransferase [Pseudomonadota bacterium]